MLRLSKLFLAASPLIAVPIFSKFPQTKNTNKWDRDLNLNQLNRKNLFETSEIQTEQLNSLLIPKYKDPTKLQISEKQVETILVPFLREKLNKILENKGLNSKDLKGRVYFSIKDLTVEILILWNENIYSKEFTHFDRFSITLNA